MEPKLARRAKAYPDMNSPNSVITTFNKFFTLLFLKYIKYYK